MTRLTLHADRRQTSTSPGAAQGFAPTPRPKVRALEGAPLESGARREMERVFSHDFSRVRVWADDSAARNTAALGARAVALGESIWFGRDQYDPKNKNGRHLIAHELAHVVQQKRGTVESGLAVSTEGSPAEIEARRAANQATAGRAVRITTSTPANIAREPLEATDKIAGLLTHLTEGRSDVDTLAAALTDDEMRSLGLDDRVSLVAFLATGFVVGDEDEATIIRLIGTVPAEETGALLDRLNSEQAALLQTLEAAINFAEYTEYHQALRTIFFASQSPETLFEKAEDAKVFPWADPGLIEAMWNVRFHYDPIEFTPEGKLRISYWVIAGPLGLQTVPTEVDPFELIKVRFYHSEEVEQAEAGETVLMPAVNLLSLYYKQFKQELATTVDVGLLFAGGAGLVTAGSKAQKAIAALDLLLGASDLAIREFRPEISKLDGGKEFLEVWDIVSTLIAIYGVTRILMEVPTAFSKLRQAYGDFKARSQGKLDKKLTDQLDDEMDEISETAEEAKDELNISDGDSTKTSDVDTPETGSQPAPGKETGQGAGTPKASLQAWPDAAEQARLELQRARERGGPIVVNIGGKGEYPDAINLNPNTSSVDVSPDWPNWVNAPGESIADLFPPGSIDELFSSKLPPGVMNWDEIAQGSMVVLKPGGKVAFNQLGPAKGIPEALERAGFTQIEVLHGVAVTAVKTAP